MLRKLTVAAALAAGMSIAATIALATPALAKGPSQARITGPGLAHAVVVSGTGEPGQPGKLGTLAQQTRLFFAMFGWLATVPPQLRIPPPKASVGPRYTIIYTVPGVTPQPGEQFGQIRQDLFPRAAGGPLVYTPSGQHGFGGPLSFTGWVRASPGCPAPLPGSAFHRHWAHRRPRRASPPLRIRWQHIRWQHSERAHERFPGSSRPPRPSRQQRLLAPCCCCVTASQPPPMTASREPVARLPGQPEGSGAPGFQDRGRSLTVSAG